MNNVQLACINNVELDSMNKVELANTDELNKVELANMNNEQRYAGQHEQRWAMDNVAWTMNNVVKNVQPSLL